MSDNLGFTPVAAEKYTRPADGPYGANPYITQQANNIQAQSNQNLATNVMPGIGQGAQMAGQYGGSRQGVAQGVAAAQAQNGVNSAQANLYSTAYGQDQNYNVQNRGLDLQGQSMNNQYALGQGSLQLQNKSIDNNYALGQGQLAMTNQGQMQNFYTANRGLDQSGMQLGANLYNMGNSGNVAAGQGQAALGQQYQNAPLNALQQYSNTISPYSGLGGSQISTANSGGGAQGAIGGALAGAQIGKNLGFGSSSGSGFTPTYDSYGLNVAGYQ